MNVNYGLELNYNTIVTFKKRIKKKRLIESQF